MSTPSTCTENLLDINEKVSSIVSSGQVSDFELKAFLACRAAGKIDFVLVDIREMFEYTDLSIKGADMLLPTSTLHLYIDKLEAIKDKFIILYCRTGNRTGQILQILQRMAFSKIAHLSFGIVDYSGEKVRNAPLPDGIEV